MSQCPSSAQAKKGLWKWGKKSLLNMCKQMGFFFSRHVIVSNLINVSKKQNNHQGSADVNTEHHISDCFNRTNKSFSKGCCRSLVHLKYSYCCNMSSMYEIQKDVSSIFCRPVQIVVKDNTLLLDEFSFSSPESLTGLFCNPSQRHSYHLSLLLCTLILTNLIAAWHAALGP